MSSADEPGDQVPPTTAFRPPAAVLPSRVRLLVADGPDRGRELMLERGTYVIGKSTGCDLVLSDPGVSRRHLEVVVDDARLVCRDLGSTNGSFFGGAEFQQIAVTVGAEVVIGATRLTLVVPDTRLPAAAADAATFAGMVGESPRMQQVFELCRRAAAADAPVLLLGETGTGKEACARAIHRASPRRDGPFVVCDLAALSRGVIESELFGHVRGAFTGATASHAGAFMQADRGTIFIDEIGELEPELQPRLLRALDRRETKPVGGAQWQPTDTRVIAATNRRLDEEVKAGRLRSDLYYRLSVLKVILPPLRERKADIAPLARRFATDFRPGRPAEVAPETLALLEAYDWPGNVRELRNTIERALAMAPEALRIEPQVLGLDLPDVPPLPAAGAADVPFHEAKERLVGAWEREYLTGLLRRTGGNVAAAARRAGIHRAHLYRLLQKHSLASE
jgi:two-component system nitrogen regulation response regulator GlnG